MPAPSPTVTVPPGRVRPTRGTDRGPRRGRAWSVLAAATLAAAIGPGTITTHGVLVAALAGSTIAGVTAGAVLVALSAALQFGLGPTIGAATDRHGIRVVVGAGAVLYAGGAAAAAIATSLGHLELAVLVYAVGTGAAGACTLAPLFATVAGWFDRRRAAAVGIVTAGSGFGSLVLAPWVARVLERDGLGRLWMVVAVAGGLGLTSAAAALRSPPQATPPAPRLRFRTVWADPPLRRFYLAGVLGSTGMFAAMTYLVPFARELGLRAATPGSLLGLTGAVSIASRLAVGAVPAAHAYRVYRGSQVVLGAAGVLWWSASHRGGALLAFVVIYGLAAGAWSALAPLVVAEAHADRLASVLGVLYTSPGIGGALGPLAVTALLRVGPMAAVGFFLTVCFLAAVRVLRPLTPLAIGGGS
jgi:MFS family permease